MADERPNPDALLRRVEAEEARQKRGKLKVFFGFAPGVGKTFAMLESARRAKAAGVDVVVGVVETHGRAETGALLEGLELLPKRRVAHKGVTLEELDLDAALRRRPQVLLLDELAHTNAPGSRHTKRHQDVAELLDAGIDVHTTVNVQHLESLNDVVAQVTQVRVRETVPDSVLDRADEIELIDLPPEELLERLRAGKVYLPEQALRAASSFFRRGNLLALRELALRRTAEQVDAEVRAYRQEHAIGRTWPTSERILVCIGPAPGSARLVRTAARMAGGLRAPWVAAYVEVAAAPPLPPTAAERLEGHLQLAQTLGAEVVRLSGASVSAALLAYARDHNVTRIVLGKPTHSRLRDFVRGSLLDDVVRGSGDVDVTVTTGEPESQEVARAEAPRAEPGASLAAYVGVVGLVAAATALGAAFRELVGLPDQAMIYLLVIMVAAARFGRGPAIAAAALSVAAFDFFFVPPFFTFAVSDTSHLLTFATMFVVGLAISGLALRIRRQQEHARQREERTAALFALSRELGSAIDERQVAVVLARHVSGVFGTAACVMLPAPGGALSVAATAGELEVGPAHESVARWVLEHGRIAGRGTDTLPGAGVCCAPLRSGAQTLGVLVLAPSGDHGLSLDDRRSLETFARQGALAIDRARLAEEAKSAALRARAEEMRSSLLSAVSHDLRTPLAAITGAASALRDEPALVEPVRADLVETICEEADRLERLVRNLLDMTRLDSGAVKPRREWVPLEEVVGSALGRLEKRLSGRAIETALGADLPLLLLDPVLFEQVFVNLLENALKYTPPGSPITIRAEAPAGQVVIEVSDRGPGVPLGMEERLFDKFVRGQQGGPVGAGLGLAICRAIVAVHDGSIVVENRDGGGATFRITLPVQESVPSLVPEAPSEPSVDSEARVDSAAPEERP